MHPLPIRPRLGDLARRGTLAMPAAFCAALLIALCARDARAQACVPEDCQPPPNSAYGGTFHFTFSGGGLTADLANPNLHSFTTCTAVPPSVPAATTTHVFDAVMDCGLSLNGGPSLPTTAPAHVTIFDHFNHLSGSTRYFDTEMVQLDLAGGTLPPLVMIRESPTLASLGQTTIQDLGGGSFRIDSFFDVFVELSTDGGQTWIPCNNCPGHMTLSGPGCPTPARSETWGHIKVIYR